MARQHRRCVPAAEIYPVAFVDRLAVCLLDFPFHIAGRAERGAGVSDCDEPFDGAVAGTYTVPTVDPGGPCSAGGGRRAGGERALSAASRAAALDHISARLAERVDEVAELITAENGKPIMWARAEANRAVSTFRWAAEEARRFSGELMRLDTDAAAAGRMAVIRRFARGPVLGISPFNFPLNLAAHKVAPAIACGAPIILKPAPKTPLSALLLGQILAETDLPEGSWSVLPVADETSAELVTDPRLPVISFTGSEHAWRDHRGGRTGQTCDPGTVGMLPRW
jgi:glyceraldehyde-3-phosphate dehydrogenase (NADP+)